MNVPDITDIPENIARILRPVRHMLNKREGIGGPASGRFLPEREIHQLVADAREQAEESRIIGAAGEPPFQNGWVNYGIPTYGEAFFYKDPFGRVHLSGLVKLGAVGSGVPIFTLPTGYRPAHREIHASVSNNVAGRVDIEVTGVVSLNVGANAWVSLSGITFRAA